MVHDADMVKTTDIAELVKATRAATLADEEQNRLEQKRLEQEERRLKIEQSYVDELMKITQVVEHCKVENQRPIVTLLVEIQRLCDTMLKLIEVIAARVIGDREATRLIDAIARRGDTVHVEVGNSEIDIANDGDVDIVTLAGRDVKGKKKRGND